MAAALCGCGQHPVDVRNLDLALLKAVRQRDAATVRRLLKEGANVETRNESGETVLIQAGRNDSSEIVEMLLDGVSDPKEKDKALFAAIHLGPVVLGDSYDPGRPSVFRDSEELKTVKLLLEKGANLEARDEEGDTPLIYAASYAAPNIVQLLLEKGAKVEAQDLNGFTALQAAACGGCVSIDMGSTFGSMQLLLQKGANVEARDNAGATALMLAARYGRTDIMELLLDHGARVEDRDSEGNTALIIAAPSGTYTATGVASTVDAVRFLLNHRSEINARNNQGQTALIAAVAEENASEASEVIRLLLSRGADVSIRDLQGHSALQVAKKNGYTDAARLLEDAREISRQ